MSNTNLTRLHRYASPEPQIPPIPHTLRCLWGPYQHYDSPSKKQLIGVVVKAGISVKKAAKMFEMPYELARDIVRKFQNTGSTHHQSHKRPRCLTIGEELQIIRTVRKDRLLPLWHVRKIFDPWVSTTTIQDVLKKYGYHRRPH
jgi:transposase